MKDSQPPAAISPPPHPTEPAQAQPQRLLSQLPPQTPHPVLRFFRQIGPAGPMALIVTCLPAIGAVVLAGFAKPVSHWLAGHGIIGLLLFVIGHALTGGFALVP